MGQFSVEKPVLPGSALSGNQHRYPYPRGVRQVDKHQAVQDCFLVEGRNFHHAEMQRLGIEWSPAFLSACDAHSKRVFVSLSLDVAVVEKKAWTSEVDGIVRHRPSQVNARSPR